jgi:predicted acylesterase/phospholipase RssA
MAETVLKDSRTAPAVTPVSPNHCRRPRAAEGHARRLSPTAGDTASEPRPRPPFECIALLLQGGGALGAYQAGVYEALAEADLHPDWIAGISIGAINGALIAGKAADALNEVWDAVGQQQSALGPSSLHRLQGETHA